MKIVVIGSGMISSVHAIAALRALDHEVEVITPEEAELKRVELRPRTQMIIKPISLNQANEQAAIDNHLTPSEWYYKHHKKGKKIH